MQFDGQAHKYAEDIRDGNIIACDLTKKAINRYFDDLKNGKKRGLWFDEKSAQHRIDFYKYCKHSKGQWAGQIFHPEPWQQFIDWNIYGWKREDGTRRFRTAYLELARKNGKSTKLATDGLYMLRFDGEEGAEVFNAAPLSMHTMIPTPDGFTSMGDIKIGDTVFDENGYQCNVTYVSPIMYNKACYEITFKDGTKIISDANHRWSVEAIKTHRSLSGMRLSTYKNTRKKGRTPITCTTKEISQYYKNGSVCNYRIPLAKTIKTDEKTLPIAPYTLGVWLGDGRSNRGSVVLHPDDCEIVDYIRQEGYDISEHGFNDPLLHFTILDIRKNLRAMNLIDNKHIPATYLRGSERQRMALLRGLMDTDGTCTKTGECRFTNRIKSITDGVAELIASLGMKPSAGVFSVEGKPHYIVSFRPHNGDSVFKLQRKSDRHAKSVHDMVRNRYICDVKKARSEPVRCISVDSSSHLYLVTDRFIATHNTKKDQANIIHSESLRMVKKSPQLKRVLRTNKYSIFSEEKACKYQPLGADSHTEDGLNTHCGLLDEYHAHKDAGMYDQLRSSMGARLQPLLFIITTAGYEKYCACYEERQYLADILNGRTEDDSYFGIIYTLDDSELDKWDDESVWQKANPNLGVSVSVDDMRDLARKAKRSPQKQNEFLTKKLNIWTESITAWITQEAWNEARIAVDADALAGRKCVGAFDLSTTTDITAWVLCFLPEEEGDRYQFVYRFFVPEQDLEHIYPQKDVLALMKRWIKEGYVQTTPGNVIDYDYVQAQIEQDAEKYDITAIPYDPYNASQLVNQLMDLGFNMVKFSQGAANMSPASKDFEQKILSNQVASGGNPVIDWMVRCTEVKQFPDGNIKPVKPDRRRSSKRIDGTIASIMALAVAVNNDDETIYKDRGLIVI